MAYLDLTGSGAETIAHLRQNGRITIMFCSFGETPKILRLQGRGQAVLPGEPDWDPLARHFPLAPGWDTGRDGHRAIIVAELDRIADSCGYSIPVMELVGERDSAHPVDRAQDPRAARGVPGRAQRGQHRRPACARLSPGCSAGCKTLTGAQPGSREVW